MTAAPLPLPPGTPTDDDTDWIGLADELTPAKSLARVDATATRVVSQIAVVGTLITAGGLVASATLLHPGPTRWLVVAAAALAVAAVVIALACQVLSVSQLHTHDLVEVQDWYRIRVSRRAWWLRVATWLIVAAGVVGGTAAVWALALPTTPGPEVTLSRVAVPATATAPASSTVTVHATVHGVPDDGAAAVRVSSGDTVLATAAATPASDGTASLELIASADATSPVTIEVTAPGARCAGTVASDGSAGVVVCHR